MTTATARIVPIVVAFPRVDPNEVRIDLRAWLAESIAVLTEHFGRADIHENDPHVVLVVCESTEDRILNPSGAANLRDLLHRFGRTTRVHEVGVVVGNRLYQITDYDYGDTT